MIKTARVMKWVVWSLAGVLYLYEYFIRVAPSVMVPELMSAFAVNATAIGVLSGFFFYIYAPLQLPVGVLIDQYGARKLLTFSGIVAGLGTLLFGIADYYWVAAAGRFLMGAGSSFGFVGIVYICSHWFEEKRRGIMIGLANTIGMIGAILAQGPLRLGLNALGWRVTFIILAVFGVFIGTLLYVLVRDDPPNVPHPHIRDQHAAKHLWQNVVIGCKNSQTWISSLMALFFYVSTATFAGLWGIPFIQATYGISTERAGFAISMIFVGWAIGGPIIGIYSDRIRQKKSILAFTTLIGFVLMSCITYLTNPPIAILFILLLLVGFASSAQLLNFSYSIDVNPLSAKGTAAAFVNFIVVLGTALMQPFIGYLLDLNWTGQMAGDLRVYSAQAYKVAMTCFPASFFLAFLLTLFMKQNPRVVR